MEFRVRGSEVPGSRVLGPGGLGSNQSAALAVIVALLSVWGYPAVRAQDRPPAVPTDVQQLAALKIEGEILYNRDCASCHGADGTGDGAGPALAGSANLANKEQVIRRILEGAIDRGMEPFAQALNDREVAAVGTFVRNAWDNTNGAVLEAEVKALRDLIKNTRR
jgi:mono/diheme cytochrome c family protein